VTDFLYGSAVIVLALWVIGSVWIAFEGTINGAVHRRRDRLAARLVAFVLIASAWVMVAIAIGKEPR
jgi:hypothetical protein